MQQLGQYKHELKNNEKTLKTINEKLSIEFDLLRHDPEMVSLKARELGYFKPNEGLIILSGYPRKASTYPVGRLMLPFEPFKVNYNLFRVIAVLIGLIVFLVTGLSISNYKKQ